MVKLPQKTIWSQFNRSDRLGDIWSSYNLDITSKLGSLRVSPRLLLNISSSDDSDLGVPCAFRFFETGTGATWAVAGSYVWYSTGGPNTAFIQDGTGFSPTNCNSYNSDMEFFNGYLYVTATSTSLYKVDSTPAWTTLAGRINNSAGRHCMTSFRAQNRLYFVDDNSKSVGSISTGDTAATMGNQYTLQSLVDGTSAKISWIRSTSTRIWIGTVNFIGNKAKIYAWDGSDQTGPTESYQLEASGSLACVIKDDVPVIFDTKGRLLQLNGATFTELDRLPLDEKHLRPYLIESADVPVHYNGMTLIDGKINILINTVLYDTNSTNKENVPSGVWEYTKETGLYHKQSVGHTKSDGTIVDYGQQKLSQVGAIAEIEQNSGTITQGTINGRFMCGAAYYTTATATLKGILYEDTNDTLQKAGCITTPKIFSSNIDDSWNKFIPYYRKLQNSNNKIVIKCRTTEEDSTEMTITWTSTTTFTTSTNIIGKEKYEFEVLQGTGSGRTAHLTATSYNGSIYSGTVDETFTGATGTAKARVQNWKKLGSITDQTSQFKNFGNLTDPSSWIQFRVWCLFQGKDELQNFLIISSAHQLAQ